MNPAIYVCFTAKNEGQSEKVDGLASEPPEHWFLARIERLLSQKERYQQLSSKHYLTMIFAPLAPSDVERLIRSTSAIPPPLLRISFPF